MKIKLKIFKILDKELEKKNGAHELARFPLAFFFEERSKKEPDEQVNQHKSCLSDKYVRYQYSNSEKQTVKYSIPATEKMRTMRMFSQNIMDHLGVNLTQQISTPRTPS